ncbi:twin-arginine translocase TatA/TatE family subunit [Thermomicrobium sp. 4228-Ro]|uniref:twin-arginine translocase TatA/TatE family subunit n=1 Tax=Thermomicrobium sp. 4228-Ro TaxID=2993937 RepID=UPI002248F7ED|nr:twin-arginine translocase TatA/TatE family subunit [Thermomicrobium sp. 4228-Ro]MCX2726127.1 twin-arginine translocase TatA/TatE family subunit [Thermomicrobium sp. 4228-Ro]
MVPLLVPSLGWQELLIVLLIVLIVFGASRLPELGGALGRTIREFRAATKEPVPDTRDKPA